MSDDLHAGNAAQAEPQPDLKALLKEARDRLVTWWSYYHYDDTTTLIARIDASLTNQEQA